MTMLWLLDSPFLNSSALEDEILNSALNKYFFVIIIYYWEHSVPTDNSKTLYTTPVLPDFWSFKMPYAALFLDKTRPVILNYTFKNYIGFQYHNVSIGWRGFAFAAPTEWNKLPPDVASSKTKLKTYLFRLAYPPP